MDPTISLITLVANQAAVAPTRSRPLDRDPEQLLDSAPTGARYMAQQSPRTDDETE